MKICPFENHTIRRCPGYRHILAGMAAALLFSASAHSQHLLDQKISVTVYNKPLQQTLVELGRQGGFYFSYNSLLLPGDSLVSVSAHQETVQDILQALLGNDYTYDETAGYVIIRKYAADGKAFVIKGYVLDKKTGEKLADASVYEIGQFVSTLTDEQGQFRLRLHNRSPDISVQVSKRGFNDTLYRLRSGREQTAVLLLSPIRTVALKPVTITPDYGIEKYGLGRWLISSRQKISDLNISDFFVRQPFQYSLWPGIGTHGKLSAQAVNKFSFNLLGGYSGGARGFELGGLFNLDKNDVRHVQIAGLFNTVGGHMGGIQVAGIHNSVWNGIQGVQIAGLSNTAKQPVRGVQIAGIANQAKSVAGLQIAGISNISRQTVNGLQIAGILNRARKVEGWQIGLLNIADTAADGYSIGLINIIKHQGYYRLSLFWSDPLNLNIAIKTGNQKLYNLLLASFDPGRESQTFSAGYGLGKEFPLTGNLSLTTELTAQSFFTGYKNDVPVLVRLQPAAQIRLNKHLSLFAGPSFSLFLAGSSQPAAGHTPSLPPVHHLTLWRSTTAWFGAQAGINLF